MDVRRDTLQGARVAPSVKYLTLAQVMISRIVSSSPTSGSTLMVQSLLGILSLCPFRVLSLKNKLTRQKKKRLEKIHYITLYQIHNFGINDWHNDCTITVTKTGHACSHGVWDSEIRAQHSSSVRHVRKRHS